MSASPTTPPAEMSDDPTSAPPTTPQPTPAPAPSDRLTKLAYGTRTALALLVLGVGGLGFYALWATKSLPARSDLGSAQLQVRTLEAHMQLTPRVWEGFGTARAMFAADVRAQVGGIVIERPSAVEAGAPIAMGGTIIKIEPLDYAQRVTQAEKRAEALMAELSGLEIEEQRLREQLSLSEQEHEAARRDFQRVREAIEAGAGSVGELDQRESAMLRIQRTHEGIAQQVGLIPSRRARLEARLIGDQATLRIERENLARTTIASPIDGVLQTIDFERGELVVASQRVARIVDLRRIEIPLRLPKSASGSVAIGDRVELRSDSPSGLAWSGSIVRIAPEIDASTRTLEVFVEVGQDPASERRPLLPGQFVVGSVWTSVASERVVLPRRAIVADRVFLAEPIAEGGLPDGIELGDGDELRRVRPALVRVEFHLGGFVSGDLTGERDWSVLDPVASIPDGSLVILSNLDQLIEGMVVRLAQIQNEAPSESAHGSD